MMNFAVIAVVAILIEALVEYAKTVYKAYEDQDYKLFATHICTIAIGILVAFLFNAQIFNGLGIAVNDVADLVLSGVILSRGSNYVSDFVTRISGAKDNPFDGLFDDEIELEDLEDEEDEDAEVGE